MPIQSVKLKPGVNTERTFTLNEAAISESQLIRFKDGLPQAIGGWSDVPGFVPKFSAGRAILSFADLNGVVYTAIGCDNGYCAVFYNGMQLNISIGSVVDNETLNFSTVSGSPTVTIAGVGGGIPTLVAGQNIFIVTTVSVGGLILSGNYLIASVVSLSSFTITAPSNATATVNNGGSVPEYTTTSSSLSVNVFLANHGQVVGSQWTEAIPLVVDGIVVGGSYIVESVVNSNNFTIYANTAASSTASAYENGNQSQIVYYGGQVLQPAPRWTFDHFGETLLACPGNGPIYSWTPNTGQISLEVVTGAPAVVGGIFVAQPAQILIAWASSVGNEQQPNLLSWSAQQNYNEWTPLVTNQAGNSTIPTGSRIVGGIQAPSQALIFTDVDAYAMNYLGGNAATEQLVFGFNQIAKGCGLVGPYAAGVLNGNVYWMSNGQFMMLGADGVVPIPCSVWDIVFQDLNTQYNEFIVCGVNSLFNEVWWFYTSISSGLSTNDAYVKLNVLENTWDYGVLPRTAWQDYSAFGNPLASDVLGNLIIHENSVTLPSEFPWSFTTGAFMISEGDKMMFVDWMLPDFRYGPINSPTQDANITVVVNAYRYANDVPVPSQTMTCTPSGNGEIALRLRGRALSITVSGQSFARLGNLRYRAAPDGKY